MKPIWTEAVMFPAEVNLADTIVLLLCVFGFGEMKYNLWWIVVSMIVMGVGIGVLARPQPVVRFMTVRSKRELNRAVGVGGVFILAMTGVAFTTGTLSNASFTRHGPLFRGRVPQRVKVPECTEIRLVQQSLNAFFSDQNLKPHEKNRV